MSCVCIAMLFNYRNTETTCLAVVWPLIRHLGHSRAYSSIWYHFFLSVERSTCWTPDRLNKRRGTGTICFHPDCEIKPFPFICFLITLFSLHTHTFTHTHRHTHTHAHTLTDNAHTQTHTHTHAQSHTHMKIYTYTHTHIHTHKHTP